jgi:hypothetical protein
MTLLSKINRLPVFISCIILTGFGYAQSKTEAKWNFIFDGYNTTDLGDMAVDPKGNAYVGINYSMELTVPELKKKFTYGRHVSRAIIKLDKKGKAIWGLDFESAYDGRINTMTIAPNGDLLVAGFFDGVGTFPSIKKKTIKLGFPKPKGKLHQTQFLFLARYSPKGDCIWAKAYHEIFGQSGDLEVNSKGEIYWSFYHTGTLKEGAHILDSIAGPMNKKNRISIYKLDKAGKLIKKIPLRYREKEWDSSKPPQIHIDHQDNVLLYGPFKGSIGFTSKDSLTNDGYYDSHDAYLAKYTSKDSLAWLVQFGGRNHQRLKAVTTNEKGKIFVTGSYSYECSISKGVSPVNKTKFNHTSTNSFFYCAFMPNGDTDFANFYKNKDYGNDCEGVGIALDQKGVTYISGTFDRTLDFNNPNIDSITSKDHTSFSSVWLGDSLVSTQKDIQSDKSWSLIQHTSIQNNQLYTAGIYYGKTELITPSGKKFKYSAKDHGRSTFVYASNLATINVNVDQEWSDSLTNNHLENIEPMLSCTDPSKVDSTTWHPIEKDSVATINAPCGVHLENVKAILYPNPTQRLTTLKIGGIKGKIEVNIISESGQLLYSQQVIDIENQQQLDFDLGNSAPGVYYFLVKQDNFKKVLRLVKTN